MKLANLTKSLFLILPILFLIVSFRIPTRAQPEKPNMHYTVSIPDPASQMYQVQLRTSGWKMDTLLFKMPNWMPGYYQMMNYSNNVQSISAEDSAGKTIKLNKTSNNTWEISGIKDQEFVINYEIKTSRKFVATSFVDANHAYLVPGSTFLYAEGFLDIPVSVTINPGTWKKIATGLDPVGERSNDFTAPDFDILYDCPILIGNLTELPSFEVNNVEHHFIGYEPGDFDYADFILKLKAMVESAVAMMGDIPYKKYTFIAIGPGRGGIEHLNNTTVSFSGNQLNTEAGMNRMLFFLAHEYFHHYNVKRIRPFELGPFDYENGSRTNLLWISEGLSVYYEYLLVRRAGLINDSTLFSSLAGNINAVENNPGRLYQSLSQASYNTWREGPFGTQGADPAKSISYYEKGPVVGLLLDFAIRDATGNKKSLDDVMRLLYYKFYKEARRGFTDAEFQAACETIAGKSLAAFFEYVYTTKELDYETYLKMAGLKLVLKSGSENDQKKAYIIQKIEDLNPSQSAILNSWLGEN